MGVRYLLDLARARSVASARMRDPIVRDFRLQATEQLQPARKHDKETADELQVG